MRLRPSSGCHRDDRGDGAIGGQLALTVTRDFDAGSGALLAAAFCSCGDSAGDLLQLAPGPVEPSGGIGQPPRGCDLVI
jgi:hypothetical protein